MVEPIATVKQGQIKGVTDTDLNGETYYKFLGIPYAKPPIGPLRFRAPQPAESWTGIRDATKEGNQCFGIDTVTYQIAGSEDCLYLNIFTKQLPKAGLKAKPVMVFIHGGGFVAGSGSERVAGSKHLLAEDIVLVSINYRLGIFGFLSSDDLSLDIPGNAGLKDQTFALKWVQENISSFNGDPNNVTIFGSSAGGAAVHFQVLSLTGKGLFHKAIAQSGAALNPWAWGQKNVIQVAEKLGKKLSSEKDAFNVLMNTSSDELYQAAQKFPDQILEPENRRPFGPVIEKPNPTAFLSENPTDLLASGKFNQVPTIIGLCSNEGLLTEFKMEKMVLNINPKKAGVYWSLGIEKNSERYAKILAKINNFYFPEGETDEAIHAIIGDVDFLIGMLQSAKLTAKTSLSPVYFYVFSYENELTKILCKSMGLMGIADKFKGVPHGGEHTFLFNFHLNNKSGEIEPKIMEKELIGIKQITKIWTDFARTGRPHELWEPVTNINELKYFDIDKEPKLKVNPFAERMAVWHDIFGEIPFNAHYHE